MWSGGIPESDFIATIERLSDADLQRYFELGGQALTLELHSKEPLPRFELAFISEGVEEIARALPSAEQEALLQTVDRGVEVPPAEGCKAMQQVLAGALQMPLERGARFMAGLSNPTLVDG